MKYIVTTLIIILLLNSCSERPSIKHNNSPSQINFTFTALSSTPFDNLIEIHATLYNEREDTVYLLTSSCYGEQYSLEYDKSLLDLNSLINCNASFPIIIKIAPKEKHSFKSHFKPKVRVKKLKLGFDFFEVSKDFTIENKGLSCLQRPLKDQTIIWSEEVTIK
jgi:hypothetical protein